MAPNVTCSHNEEPDYCDACKFDQEKRMATIPGRIVELTLADAQAALAAHDREIRQKALQTVLGILHRVNVNAIDRLTVGEATALIERALQRKGEGNE